jgi:hypothetical protein
MMEPMSMLDMPMPIDIMSMPIDMETMSMLDMPMPVDMTTENMPMLDKSMPIDVSIPCNSSDDNSDDKDSKKCLHKSDNDLLPYKSDDNHDKDNDDEDYSDGNNNDGIDNDDNDAVTNDNENRGKTNDVNNNNSSSSTPEIYLPDPNLNESKALNQPEAFLNSHMAGIFSAVGSYMKAEILYEKSLNTCKHIYSANTHPRVLGSILNLAGVLLVQRKYVRALDLYIEGEKMILLLYYKMDLSMGSIKTSIAACLRGLNRYVLH